MSHAALPLHTAEHRATEARLLDEGLDYFGAQGRAQQAKDEKTLSRIEQQREWEFDVPGVTQA